MRPTSRRPSGLRKTKHSTNSLAHRTTWLRSDFCTRAPFRLLPIRAPRQAVLRTSSWLAPSRITNRPCDLPVEKTRDASNRYLPPKRTACTRTSRVPSSSRNFRCGDTPRRLRLRAVVPGDRTFHDVRGPLRRIVIGTSPTSRPLLRVVSVGVLFPRYRWRSNLWHPCRESLFTLSPHTPSCALLGHHHSPFWRVYDGSEDARSRQDHPERPPVTADAS